MAAGTGKPGSPSSATGYACGRCCTSAGSPTPTVPTTSSKWLRCFTDSEWAAARELLLLSAGLAPSSSALPSAATPKHHTPSDELRGGPRPRRPRRRTLASLYEATSPVGLSGRGDGNLKRRRVLHGDSNHNRDGDRGYACAIIRRGGR